MRDDWRAIAAIAAVFCIPAICMGLIGIAVAIVDGLKSDRAICAEQTTPTAYCLELAKQK